LNGQALTRKVLRDMEVNKFEGTANAKRSGPTVRTVGKREREELRRVFAVYSTDRKKKNEGKSRVNLKSRKRG